MMWLRKGRLVAVEPAAHTKKGLPGVKLTRTAAERPQNRMLDAEPGESMLRWGCKVEVIDPMILQVASLMVCTPSGASTA